MQTFPQSVTLAISLWCSKSWQKGLERQSCQSPARSIFNLVAETTFKATKSEEGDSHPAGHKPLSGRPALQPDTDRPQCHPDMTEIALSETLSASRPPSHCSEWAGHSDIPNTKVISLHIKPPLSKLVATDGLVSSPQCCALSPSQWKDNEGNQPFPCKQKVALLLVNTLVI